MPPVNVYLFDADGRPHGTGYEPDLYDPNVASLSLPAILAADMPRKCEQIDTDFPIYSQGAENSCTGWSVKEAVQIVVKRTTGLVVSVSARFIWELAKAELGWQGLNNGCRISDAIKIGRTHGFPTEERDPRPMGDMTWPGAEAFAQAKDHPLIDAETALSVAEVKTALLQRHPDVFGMTLTESFDLAGRTGKYARAAGRKVGGHAMTIVQYDDDCAFDDFPPGGFKVRNHWRPSWGLDGWFWLPYSVFASEIVGDSYVLRVVGS